TKTQFIDASGEVFFKKVTNNNILEEKHIAEILNIFDSKENIDHVAVTIDNKQIAENDYNLSVSSYVEAKDTREVINIETLNQELDSTVQSINNLRASIANIIKEIEA